jgi:GNAT superfamily N-acetyltransferase
MSLDQPHSSPARIREAAPADASAIIALLEQADRLHVSLRPDLFQAGHRDAASVSFGSQAGESEFLVAEDEGCIVGLAEIRVMSATAAPMFRPLRKAFVLNLVVDAQCRRRGIGSQLIRAIRDWAVQRSLDRVEVNVFAANSDAVRFYQQEGFAVQAHRLELPLSAAT